MFLSYKKRNPHLLRHGRSFGELISKNRFQAGNLISKLRLISVLKKTDSYELPITRWKQFPHPSVSLTRNQSNFYEIAPERRFLLWIDMIQGVFTQIQSNLLQNAIKHSVFQSFRWMVREIHSTLSCLLLNGRGSSTRIRPMKNFNCGLTSSLKRVLASSVVVSRAWWCWTLMMRL